MRADNNKLKQYVMECINPEAYDVTAETDREKLQFLMDTFKNEYGHWLQHYGNTQNTFKEWIMGLPSSFHVDYENHKILEIGRTIGVLSAEDALERKITAAESRFISGWFNRIAIITKQLCKQNGVQFELTGNSG